MTTILIILLVLAMGATAYVLVRGVIAMASGKDISGERQQNYMRKRVMFQAVAIVIVLAILALASAGRPESNSRTRATLLCDTATISRASSGAWLGK